MAHTGITYLKCPLCGGAIDWQCYVESGWANCVNGYRVSRHGLPPAQPCPWAGTPIWRTATGAVVAPNPINLDRVDAHLVKAHLQMVEAHLIAADKRTVENQLRTDKGSAEIRTRGGRC